MRDLTAWLTVLLPGCGALWAIFWSHRRDDMAVERARWDRAVRELDALKVTLLSLAAGFERMGLEIRPVRDSLEQFRVEYTMMMKILHPYLPGPTVQVPS